MTPKYRAVASEFSCVSSTFPGLTYLFQAWENAARPLADLASTEGSAWYAVSSLRIGCLKRRCLNRGTSSSEADGEGAVVIGIPVEPGAPGEKIANWGSF